jgi:hypothetical protein
MRHCRKKIIELEDTAVELIQNEHKEKKRLEKKLTEHH